MTIALSTLVDIVGGTFLSKGSVEELCLLVSTDSRRIPLGGIYVALQGERFDGHDFAKQAIVKGACACIISHPVDAITDEGAWILVPDTLLALQKIAIWWRQELSLLRVVAVTGSNGKTSTKDFTKSVLSQQFKTTATQGNLNNHIGLPLSILASTKEDEVAVWEMGMNHVGELAPLCAMARPDIGIITHVGTAHIEYMKTREAIAQEKATLARALYPTGTLIFPAEDDFASYLAESTKAFCLPVGGASSLVRVEGIETGNEGTSFTLIIEPLGQQRVSISTPGKHMVTNALLAAATGYVLGLSLETICQGLSLATLTSGRLRRFEHSGCLIFDDTYNANPDSMKAALLTLSQTELSEGGKRIAVLGKMGELGRYAVEGHRLVGRYACELGLDVLVVVGEEAQEIAKAAELARGVSSDTTIVFCETQKDALVYLKASVASHNVYLFKGSRSASMETIMNNLFNTTI